MIFPIFSLKSLIYLGSNYCMVKVDNFVSFIHSGKTPGPNTLEKKQRKTHFFDKYSVLFGTYIHLFWFPTSVRWCRHKVIRS